MVQVREICEEAIRSGIPARSRTPGNAGGTAAPERGAGAAQDAEGKQKLASPAAAPAVKSRPVTTPARSIQQPPVLAPAAKPVVAPAAESTPSPTPDRQASALVAEMREGKQPDRPLLERLQALAGGWATLLKCLQWMVKAEDPRLGIKTYQFTADDDALFESAVHSLCHSPDSLFPRSR